MLYHVGPVQMDTRPFNTDKFDRRASADIASKPVIGGLKPKESMGEGDETITFSGQLLPSKIGGLTELEAIDQLRREGEALPVMRGDGKSLGWYKIEQVSESHEHLDREGVGFVVKHRIRLTKCEPDTGAAGAVIGMILSIFG